MGVLTMLYHWIEVSTTNNVYNRNRLIETVIFYTYIIFISIQNLSNNL
jgi:hypothetical protein